MQKANYVCTALLLLALLVFAVPRVHAAHADGAIGADINPLAYESPTIHR